MDENAVADCCSRFPLPSSEDAFREKREELGMMCYAVSDQQGGLGESPATYFAYHLAVATPFYADFTAAFAVLSPLEEAVPLPSAAPFVAASTSDAAASSSTSPVADKPPDLTVPAPLGDIWADRSVLEFLKYHRHTPNSSSASSTEFH